MLMLAVTIMIAAIVSATAGNFSNTEKKPLVPFSMSVFMRTSIMTGQGFMRRL